ncbi:hypothetical protein R1sor_024362 [Riccia sorocarpa]|uniref:Uncharacterized protein n=1 Tax=Riccia sorocarpa TaxID=122646 RepID=A0ABD3GS63_9MARC
MDRVCGLLNISGLLLLASLLAGVVHIVGVATPETSGSPTSFFNITFIPISEYKLATAHQLGTNLSSSRLPLRPTSRLPLRSTSRLPLKQPPPPQTKQPPPPSTKHLPPPQTNLPDSFASSSASLIMEFIALALPALVMLALTYM